MKEAFDSHPLIDVDFRLVEGDIILDLLSVGLGLRVVPSGVILCRAINTGDIVIRRFPKDPTFGASHLSAILS